MPLDVRPMVCFLSLSLSLRWELIIALDQRRGGALINGSRQKCFIYLYFFFTRERDGAVFLRNLRYLGLVFTTAFTGV